MTRELYFDAPEGGTDANADVYAEFGDRASASSPVSEDLLSFEQRGPNTLVVYYDDGGEATKTSIDGLAAAVEAVYGVTHKRTVSS